MANYDDKNAGIDSIEHASNDSPPQVHGVHGRHDADEDIIRDLQTHGEEVGFTFRSLMAAAVSQTTAQIMIDNGPNGILTHIRWMFNYLVIGSVFTYSIRLCACVPTSCNACNRAIRLTNLAVHGHVLQCG